MHAHPVDLSLLLGFTLGFAHALEPGHGKTALFLHAAGGARHRLTPIVMGISTAVSHTLSLLVVAFAVHLTTHLITGDHLHEDTFIRWLQFGSAALIMGIGAWVIVSARRTQTPSGCTCCHHRPHDTPDSQDGVHSHHHSEPAVAADSCSRGSELKMTALLGTAVGLLPCPSALAAYFAGLSEGSLLSAYWVVVAFGAGIAIALMLAGAVLQFFGMRLRHKADRIASPRAWAYVRGTVFVGIGLFYFFHVGAAHAAPH